MAETKAGRKDVGDGSVFDDALDALASSSLEGEPLITELKNRYTRQQLERANNTSERLQQAEAYFVGTAFDNLIEALKKDTDFTKDDGGLNEKGSDLLKELLNSPPKYSISKSRDSKIFVSIKLSELLTTLTQGKPALLYGIFLQDSYARAMSPHINSKDGIEDEGGNFIFIHATLKNLGGATLPENWGNGFTDNFLEIDGVHDVDTGINLMRGAFNEDHPVLHNLAILEGITTVDRESRNRIKFTVTITSNTDTVSPNKDRYSARSFGITFDNDGVPIVPGTDSRLGHRLQTELSTNAGSFDLEGTDRPITRDEVLAASRSRVLTLAETTETAEQRAYAAKAELARVREALRRANENINMLNQDLKDVETQLATERENVKAKERELKAAEAALGKIREAISGLWGKISERVVGGRMTTKSAREAGLAEVRREFERETKMDK